MDLFGNQSGITWNNFISIVMRYLIWIRGTEIEYIFPIREHLYLCQIGALLWTNLVRCSDGEAYFAFLRIIRQK